MNEGSELGFSRAQFLRGAAALSMSGGIAAALAACGGGGSGGGGGASGGGGRVVHATLGGSGEAALKEAWSGPFTAESGVEVSFTGPPDYGKIAAMVEGDSTTWDVADVGADFTISGGADGLLEKIDWSRFGAIENQLVDLSDYGGSGPGIKAEFGVPQLFWSMVITSRTDKLTEPPRTWADMWDTEKFKGKRAFGSLVRYGTLEAALLADGVSRDEMYPLDVDRALKKLDEIRDDILWYDGASQMAQMFADGAVNTGMGWDGRISGLQDDGIPVEYIWDESILTFEAMVIPKGAPNIDDAYRYLEFCLRPESQAAFVQILKYGPVNAEAFDLLPKAKREELPGNSRQLEVALWQDYEWWSKNQEEMQKRFDAWRLA